MAENPLRIWVFIDWRNVYGDARDAFHNPNAPAFEGQILPWRYGELLVSRGPEEEVHPRRLEEVRVYTGFPSATRQPKSYGAHLRQRAAWLGTGCRVFARPLRYPVNWPQSRAEQKGVDVALAVDLVFNGARRFYDIAIVASTDTDLVPALEALCDLHRAWGTPRLEVVSWAPSRKRLRVDGVAIWCHWMNEADYQAVKDPTNYVPA